MSRRASSSYKSRRLRGEDPVFAGIGIEEPAPRHPDSEPRSGRTLRRERKQTKFFNPGNEGIRRSKDWDDDGEFYKNTSETDEDADEEEDEDEEEEEDDEKEHFVRRSQRIRKEVKRLHFDNPEENKAKRKLRSDHRSSSHLTRRNRSEGNISYRSSRAERRERRARRRNQANRTDSDLGSDTNHRHRRHAHAYGQEDDEEVSLSSTDSSEAFDKKEARRLHRERSKVRPINLEMHELSSLNLNGYKSQSKKSEKADIDPANIDLNVDWKSIGGLENHITALKEMVTLPLMYPDLFTTLSITPPRGVIFYGPPGTGKTLVARALASTCSRHGQKVSFFMRKGADCLSKWVGEAERQLRLLFEQARRMQPSIIFFDEIDGLAPVRSSRQDQIHSSIVSTLLALMDGLDNRGQVIVIGATNRIDAIDPALRRPGRFDRELRFGLPSREARAKILSIHTNKWEPKPGSFFLQRLSGKCTGYCGADLKALCTEASLEAIRRLFPQVYSSDRRLKLDFSKIKVEECDFDVALEKIVASSKRNRGLPTRILPLHMHPLLLNQLEKVVQIIGLDTTNQDDMEEVGKDIKKITAGVNVIVDGKSNMGQSYLGPAILQRLESLPAFSIDLPTLLSDSNTSCAEEALTRRFGECLGQAPAILYWPHIDLWWETATESLKATITMLIEDLTPDNKVIIMALSNVDTQDLALELREVIKSKSFLRHTLSQPDLSARSCFFSQLLEEVKKPIVVPTKRNLELKQHSMDHEEDLETNLEDLHKGLDGNNTDAANSHLVHGIGEENEVVLCKLRMFLRSVVDRLMKYFKEFVYPGEERHHNYKTFILNPICLSDIRDKVNNGVYLTVKQFLTDIDLLVSNAKEYYFPNRADGRNIINKACHLQDSAFSMVCQFPKKLEKKCREINSLKQALDQRRATAKAKVAEKEKNMREEQKMRKTKEQCQQQTPSENDQDEKQGDLEVGKKDPEVETGTGSELKNLDGHQRAEEKGNKTSDCSEDEGKERKPVVHQTSSSTEDLQLNNNDNDDGTELKERQLVQEERQNMIVEESHSITLEDNLKKINVDTQKMHNLFSGKLKQKFSELHVQDLELLYLRMLALIQEHRSKVDQEGFLEALELVVENF
mmetsp:Transcript_33407/g.56627  ORF Transcript_33407/g.56627 Transcript_33407/m.56627 type:complete len:1126 (-) Transcript_33407:94-3471(-)